VKARKVKVGFAVDFTQCERTKLRFGSGRYLQGGEFLFGAITKVKPPSSTVKSQK